MLFVVVFIDCLFDDANMRVWMALEQNVAEA